MKLKKLFAGIVAVAMMATMGVTSVFAEDAPVTPSAVTNGGQVPITKVITGTGYGSETVSLAVENDGAIYTSAHTSATAREKADFKISIPTDDKKDATIQQPADAGTTTASGTLYIQLPRYNRVGTYVYKFHEVKGATAGMTYDDSTKYLLVNVYNNVNNDGEFDANSDLLVNAVVLNSDPKSALENTTTKGDLSSLAGDKIDQINNKYEHGTYTVKKLVKGNMSDRQKEFNFQVTFENTTTDKTTIPTMKVDGKAFGTEGIENLTWTNNKATYKFTLKHNQTAEFTNVPYGMKVSVVELDDNKEALTSTTNGEYTVSYENNTETEIGKEHQTVNAVITNTSTVNVNTGVILDNAPYIALLTIVAAGAVVMIIKKRRNYED